MSVERDLWFEYDPDDDNEVPDWSVKHSRTESSESTTSSVPHLLSSASTVDWIPLIDTPPESFLDLNARVFEEEVDSSEDTWIAQEWRTHRMNVKEGKQQQRYIVRRYFNSGLGRIQDRF